MLERHFKRRPVYIRAVEWNKHGDHPDVHPSPIKTEIGDVTIEAHQGWIKVKDFAHVVEPGDFIIRAENGGGISIVKPDLLFATFEEVEVIEAEIVNETRYDRNAKRDDVSPSTTV